MLSAPDPKLSQRQVCDQYDQLRTSIVDRLFTGMQRTVVSCAKCSYQSLTYNPFMTISLACKTSIDSAIREHLSEVKTDGQYKCDKCKRESKARVSHEFVRLPPFLLLHVKRFDDLLTKIDSKILYPSQMDLRQHIQPDTDLSLLGSTNYELIGLTVHQGTINAGHYIAYVKRENTWYQFNDERYRIESEREALSQQAYLLFYRQI